MENFFQQFTKQLIISSSPEAKQAREEKKDDFKQLEKANKKLYQQAVADLEHEEEEVEEEKEKDVKKLRIKPKRVPIKKIPPRELQRRKPKSKPQGEQYSKSISETGDKKTKDFEQKLKPKKVGSSQLGRRTKEMGGEMELENLKNPKMSMGGNDMEIGGVQPEPTQRNINLGELNNIANDPNVLSIECQGPNKNILVKTRSGVKRTKISLDSEQIKKLIQEFSKTAKIPISKGVFKAAVAKFHITAVIPETVGSRFIIEKTQSSQRLQQPGPRRGIPKTGHPKPRRM